jgi:pyrophosphatase PpaX
LPPGRPIAVLFDLDGTLVDSVGLILASARHAFEGYPGRRPTDDDWIAGIGKPLRVQLEELAARPEDVEPLFLRYREFFRANHDAMTRPFPGAVEVVAALRAAGHPVGIVTAKLVEPAWRSLRHAGLAPHVQALVGADSLLEHKPDPAPVRLALSQLGRAPGEALLVGDSPHDVAAGNAAGVATAAALWGACPRAVLEAAGPRYALADVRELPAVVARLEAGRG